MSDDPVERNERVRQQCPECRLLCNLERITVTDDGLRCLECAPDENEPWYVPSDTDRCRAVRTDGGTARRTGDDHTHNGVLTLTDDGLELPERYRDVREAGTIVLRTPRSTIQHRSTAQFGDRYPLIDASHFGRAARFENPANPSLAPSSVSLKREGEAERIFEVVETDGENDSESDGDGDGHRASETDSA